FHDENGEPQKEHSIFHIPNTYAAETAKAHPEYFEWAASIHPYRADCVDALQMAHEQGARAIKWLPNGMGIDPLSAKCDRFYETAARLNMPIISHTGRECAVQGGNQDDGNPLRLRRAVDTGVKVVLAHCASDGNDVDLDAGNGRRVNSFELFSRLMDEPQYTGLLYGEISAMTLLNRAWALKPILSHPEWHSRLLNGSDYPLPGVVPLVSPASLASNGLLEEDAVPFLENLRSYNPLLFDFALKRLLRSGEHTLPASVFETRRFFESDRA
ncbi:MAG TPA: amidohydrolase family protein, partial [Methylophilaceae bacterium]|nr:amidohydrolase family protein [Methylophilaceae bacterium]